MTRIFLGNFNFEHELAADRPAGTGTGGWTGPTNDTDRQIHASLATAWVAIARANDLVVTADSMGDVAFSELAALGWPVPQFATLDRQTERVDDATLVPWGWSPAMTALAASRGWACPSPRTDVIRRINSRRFRLELEREFGEVLPGAGAAESIERLRELVAAAGQAPLGWIVKANFGMAGRESVRGFGGELLPALLNWARRRIEQTGCVVFEPIVEALGEAGIQIEIPERGLPELIGVTPLLVDRAGTYRGSRIGNQEAEALAWQPAIKFNLRVAERLQQIGYFGPLGVDVMKYRAADGETRLRPLQDLNARYTMGRLSLGFESLVPIGWCATWLHAPRRAAAFMPRLRSALQASVQGKGRIVTTSPDGATSHHSLLLIAESPEVRKQLEKEYVRACAALARPDSVAM